MSLKENIKIYRYLFVSEFLENRKAKILGKIVENIFQPGIYLITLAQNKHDQLEFYSTLLLKQHVYENTPIFLVGIADGYDDAVFMVERITRMVYDQTGTADIRKYILEKQQEYETGKEQV